MSDLKSKKLIYLKGFLFLIIIIICAGMLFWESQKWQTVVLICALIWASARLYYFMFYVIEKYVDSDYKFSGIYSFIKYIFTKKGGGE